MIRDVSHPVLIGILRKDGQKICYVIPEYQRDYSWKKEELDDFLIDINEAYQQYKDDSNYSYFFGSIITSEVIEENSKYKKYNLIDGQQRITTFLLYLKLLYSHYKSLLSKEDNIDDKYIKLRLELGGLLWADPDDEDKILRIPKLISKKLNDTDKLSAVFDDKDTINEKDNVFYKNYNMLKEMFIKALEDFKENEIDLNSSVELYKYITFILQKIVFVQVDTESRESALKIFSVLNTRGLDLKPSDIIKAEAMGDIAQEHHSKYFDKWNEISKKTDAMNLELDTVFRYYLNLYKPRTVKGTLDENIQEIWSKNFDNKYNALIDFNKFVTAYELLLSIKDPNIWCLRHLLILGRNAYTWIPLLTAMIYRDYSNDDVKTVAKYLVKWHWLHLINGYSIAKLKSFNFSLIEEINKHVEVEKLLKILPKIMKDSENQNENYFIEKSTDKLRTMDFYNNNKWGKPFLYFIHNYEILNKNDIDNLQFQELSRNHTFEHIAPQNPKENEWIECSPENKNILGNLSILSQSKNSKAGNSFDSKSEIYTTSSAYTFTPTLSKDNVWNDTKIRARSDELIKVFIKAIN